MNIVLDLEQRQRPSEYPGDLRNIYVEDEDHGVGSCHWLPIKPMSTLSFFAEIADMLAGAGPDIIWPPGFMEDFDDNNAAGGDNNGNEDAMVDVLGSDSDSSDDDNEEDDQDQVLGPLLPPVGLEPVCVIQ